jgi:DNA helicase-2/ATP-dependent DNA helicase PcrA
MVNEELFTQRYNELNERQRQAVAAIYGPVMVIAGPGTGKTEVLAMRIANLLRSDAQVQAHEILCLTYTDEATNAMRKRLLQIIGTAAHKVNIYTFHAFCNNIIQSNSEYFNRRSMQPATDLERMEVLYSILEELPQGHALRRLSGNIYNDAGKLSQLFDIMKRENLSPESIAAATDAYINELPYREEYIYKRDGKGYKKGDLKQDLLNDEIRKMKETAAAAYLLNAYEEKMNAIGRYDFADMILWVLRAFKEHIALLQNYQERYQFILVDEFQDTNGSQNDLLNVLTAYWGDDPNIFAVGDDDQSIYEFQGARIHNITDFYHRYRNNISVIVLPNNYRSSQNILDKAAATIKNNKQRLIHQLHDLNLNKDIIASAHRFKEGKENIKPEVKEYANLLQEEADVVMQIEKLRSDGIPLKEVAVLYAQHKQAENIMALLERKGIPYNVKRPVNILEQSLIQQLISILEYIDEERTEPFSGEPILFEMMHAPYFEIAPTDIALLSLYIQQNRNKDRSLGYWRLILNNNLLLESLNLNSSKALQRLGRNIEEWQRMQPELPLPQLVEKIVYESGIVSYLLGTKDHIWNIQVLNSFFEFIKDSFSRNAKITVAELLRMLNKMQKEKISLPVQRVIQNENGVQFFTAHGAKGNEFEYVFLIGCNKKYWEDSRGGITGYKLPDNLTKTEDDKQKLYKTEVARRLFYVALTRAKKYLQVSYAAADNEGKSIEISVFVDEISTPEERIRTKLTADDLVKYMAWAISPVPEVKIELANHVWLERALQQLTMSYTTLSKYLNCPLGFYYEYLLRVPVLKSDALAFGSAVHSALEYMFRSMKDKQGIFPDKNQVVGVFRSAMNTEAASFTSVQFERRMEQGTTILSEYYDTYINDFVKNVEVEYRIARYMLNGVPVTGKIDKMEFDGKKCTVIDYKTGNPDNATNSLISGPNEKNNNGGDYWRQMVFYKLIIEHYQDQNWQVTGGRFEFIEKSKKDNKYRQVYIPIFKEDEELVMKQLKDSYARIMNHEFDKGCGEEDCHWCNFARKYQIIRPAKDAVVEIDDL